ncbi:sugar transferase [Ramlibacter humi]|nr:sugar transferase [Ramlibacter humi]
MFDIVFSVLALLVLAPLLVPVVVVLRLTGEGEVFYRQQRVGQGGRHFGLLKFATMLKNSPSIGTGTVTVAEDPRILPVGHFLRKTKINELPQLLNILAGDMSVVGPRPLTPNEFGAYSPEVQAAVARVPPGLTGIGSVVFRDEENLLRGQRRVEFYERVIAPYKGALEQWYVARRSLAVYFQLICITAWVVLFPRSRVVWRAFPDLPPPPPELGLA